jgi:uncharacterized protein YvpB
MVGMNLMATYMLDPIYETVLPAAAVARRINLELSIRVWRNRKQCRGSVRLLLALALAATGMLMGCGSAPDSPTMQPQVMPSPVRATLASPPTFLPTHMHTLTLIDLPTLIPTLSPIPDPLLLRIPYHSQLYEAGGGYDACGPAALLMVLDYLGQEKSLQKVAYFAQAIPAAEGGYDPSCSANPVCTSAGALAQVARQDYGLTVVAHDGWSLDDVRQSLANGHPVIADVTVDLRPGGTGHFVVIYGVSVSRQIVYYHDPYRGSSKSATWNKFAASWGGTHGILVDHGDPLQPRGHSFWGMVAY